MPGELFIATPEQYAAYWRRKLEQHLAEAAFAREMLDRAVVKNLTETDGI